MANDSAAAPASDESSPADVSAPPEPARIGRTLAVWRFGGELLRGLRTGVLPWVPLVISLISVSIALYTFFSIRTTPDMLIVMPRQVRIAQGGPDGVWLYVEPAFLHTGTSERVDAVVNMTLRAEPRHAPGRFADFVWRESGTWHFDPEARELSWRFTDDPGPFLVSPRNAAQFTILLNSPAQWRFEPGVHTLTLAVSRMNNQTPLLAQAEVVLSAEDIEYLNTSQGARFLTFPLVSAVPQNSTP